MSITCEANPVAIDKDFSHRRVTQILSGQLLKLLDTPVLKFVNNVGRVTSHWDKSHQS